MRKKIVMSLLFVLCLCQHSHASFLDLIQDALKAQTARPSQNTKIDMGLKEALQIGIENTIAYLGKKDGYFANAAVKILLPEEIRKTEGLLRGVGFGPQLDEFSLSMNRAAEKAAPIASGIFADAIADMSFDDANRILRGGNTAATDYLKSKTYNTLLTLFEPAVRGAMNEYQVTQQYDRIAGNVQKLPVVGKMIDLDVNRYVSAKALDGLFHVLAQEETNIRTNPRARVTDLLKDVFK
ncbi:MAG: DUF4197 domain-containing protein [Smithellaceae bacterium]